MVGLFLAFLKILGENRCYGFYEDFRGGGKISRAKFSKLCFVGIFPNFSFSMFDATVNFARNCVAMCPEYRDFQKRNYKTITIVKTEKKY